MRVLWIAAHPDDEDTQLIAWLARGRRVETAYMSLTRGDGGQNLIGNELGEALGVIRTEELLAARRIDGAHQYFGREYDFGFSKTADETLKHWPQDSVLRDVITVMRAFRPHIVITTFSGTPRDGHGHHQVSAIVARQAYDLAADTVRFPVSTFGRPWTPLKYYRLALFSPQDRTLSINVGAMIFWHAFINLGMAIGVLPVVGVTLPLFSHGGSSVITVLIGIGMLMNVSMRRHYFAPVRRSDWLMR